jgi:hypothetical protein
MVAISVVRMVKSRNLGYLRSPDDSAGFPKRLKNRRCDYAWAFCVGDVIMNETERKGRNARCYWTQVGGIDSAIGEARF